MLLHVVLKPVFQRSAAPSLEDLHKAPPCAGFRQHVSDTPQTPCLLHPLYLTGCDKEVTDIRLSLCLEQTRVLTTGPETGFSEVLGSFKAFKDF